MSRSNPSMRKERQANKTALIYVEGLHEEKFVRHLCSLYSHNTGVAVKVVRGNGGSAVSLVNSAIRQPANFDQKYVVLDADKPANEMNNAREIAKTHRIYLIENKPCLEAMLLSIKNNRSKYNNKSSVWCKKEFQHTYIDYRNNADKQKYLSVFPKALLDGMKKKIPVLNLLINIMSKK